MEGQDPNTPTLASPLWNIVDDDLADESAVAENTINTAVVFDDS